MHIDLPFGHFWEWSYDYYALHTDIMEDHGGLWELDNTANILGKGRKGQGES